MLESLGMTLTYTERSPLAKAAVGITGRGGSHHPRVQIPSLSATLLPSNLRSGKVFVNDQETKDRLSVRR